MVGKWQKGYSDEKNFFLRIINQNSYFSRGKEGDSKEGEYDLYKKLIFQ